MFKSGKRFKTPSKRLFHGDRMVDNDDVASFFHKRGLTKLVYS